MDKKRAGGEPDAVVSKLPYYKLPIIDEVIVEYRQANQERLLDMNLPDQQFIYMPYFLDSCTSRKYALCYRRPSAVRAADDGAIT